MEKLPISFLWQGFQTRSGWGRMRERMWKKMLDLHGHLPLAPTGWADCASLSLLLCKNQVIPPAWPAHWGEAEGSIYKHWFGGAEAPLQERENRSLLATGYCQRSQGWDPVSSLALAPPVPSAFSHLAGQCPGGGGAQTSEGTDSLSLFPLRPRRPPSQLHVARRWGLPGRGAVH